MKKIFITLLALTLATACKAEDSKQVTELKKRCAKLSKETGKEYLYGSGELKNFIRSEPPSDTPVRRNAPNPYNTNFIIYGKKIPISIRGSWKNPDAPLGELELAPPPIAMEIGKNYHFCYSGIKENSEKYFYIDHPETIQLMK